MAELYDLWSDEDGDRRIERLSNKRRNKRPPPHPGQSYNPHPEDHKRLLAKVAKKVKISEPKKTSKKKPSTSTAQPSTPTVDPSDSISEDVEEGTKIKDMPKPKTNKQRRALLRDKIQRRAARLRKIKNVRAARFDAVKKILKTLDAEERARKTVKRHKRLGYKLPDSDPIYCVSSELPSNLRSAKCPLNAIVREQLESFQSRLMVEQTRFQVKKRDKKRQYERDSN